MVLQEPINGGFGHKAALRVREVDGELTRDRSGSSRARLTIAVSILSGILFQIRRGLGLPSARASIPPSWYRLCVRGIENDDCSTSPMISNFSDAEYLMKRPPHPRE